MLWAQTTAQCQLPSIYESYVLMSSQICTLLFLVKDSDILLARKKRGFGKGLWNGVGGKVDANESIEQAMVRECQEEIGVTPTEFKKVALHDFVFEEDGSSMIVHAYIAHKWLGEPMETEEMAPEWFSVSEIPYKQMWEDDIHWLPLVLNGKKLHAKFVFNKENKLLSGTLHEADMLEHHG